MSYAKINGLSMYFETYGEGRPLVLLHGGFGNIENNWRELLPRLPKGRKLVLPEQQSHGRTADIDRELSYEHMAEDTAALLRELRIESADVLGFSDGGVVALGVAVRHPHLVRSVTMVGAHFESEGLTPETLEMLRHPDPDGLPERLRKSYEAIAPRPEDWATHVRKVCGLGQNFGGWKRESLRALKARVFVVIGDRDVVRPEHAVELYGLVPEGQLAVFPNADHVATLRNPDLLLPMFKAFLEGKRERE